MNDKGPQNIIEKARFWSLTVETDGRSLHALARSTVDDNQALDFAAMLDPTATPREALEEAVYSIPALLSDFGRVDVICRTSGYTAVPSFFDRSACEAAAECAGILDEDSTLFVDDIAGADARLVWTLPADTANFLARTFRNPRLHHPLGILGSYFMSKASQGNFGKTWVHFHGHSQVDIICCGADGRLRSMASKTAATDNDALFMIMSTLVLNGLNATADDLYLCGDRARREVLTPTLRRYVRYVLPVIFPSAAYRAGGDATAAPFPSVILPLCE